MIIAEKLCKRFSSALAVNQISFTIKEGETFVLLGTSGCGKTTTLRMINRLIEPTSGTLLVNGTDVQRQPAETLRRSMGYVLQNHGLFPHYTVAENIAIVPKLMRWNKEKMQQRIQQLLNKLQLPLSLLNAYPHQLSGGQQQRVGLARALAADPPILLMDEPFGALDPITKESIRKEFKELDELKRKTIVLVTHDVQEAFDLGNRICLMDKGSIAQLGTPSELLFQPANEYVRSFFNQQRLPLELKSIQLQQVWPLLKEPEEENLSAPFINADQNLWQAMELLAQQKNPNAFLWVTGENKKVKSISMMQVQQVLSYFNQKK